MTTRNGRVIPEELRHHPLVFVDDLDFPEVSEADRHHLGRVLRRRDGDTICLSDGQGRWRTAAFGAQLGALTDVREVPPPAPAICIGVVVPKGERPDLLVQKLTEVGVDRIVLLQSERSVVRWQGSEVARRLDRLRRIAREAAMQSRQLRLPVIDGVDTVGGFVDAGSSVGAGVALAEPGGAPLSLDHTWIAIGPEGGWSAGELASSDGRVGLGPSILRVETAAIATGAVLCGLRAGWVLDHDG